MPIWPGKTPDLKKRVTIFSTFEASVLLSRLDLCYGNDKKRQSLPVQKRSAAARDLFLTQILVKEHWHCVNRPGKIDILL